MLHLTVLARVLLTAPDIFGTFSIAFATTQHVPAIAPRALLIQLVDMWLEKARDPLACSSCESYSRDRLSPRLV